MNIFQQIAQTDRSAFKILRREFQAEQRALTRTFVPVAADLLAALATEDGAPLAAWKSRYFLAQIFVDTVCPGTEDEETYHRLSIARCELTNEGEWRDGITWDELMEIKAGIGYADYWAVEVFPPTEHTVDVANMRHLFICRQPSFAWVKRQPQADAEPLRCTCTPPGPSLCLYCESDSPPYN